MNNALYMEDCYLKECESEVISVSEGKFVVLDKTIFYPNSGGQLHDTGKMIKDGKEFDVVFVGKFSGKISHQIEPENEIKEGDKVKCILDWDRRYKLTRYHTASHVLATVFHKDAGALITGNQLDVDKARVDFSLENFDRDRIQEYINKANQTIDKNLAVKTYFLPREEAMKIPGIVKLAGALPPDVKELRIVEIDGFDIQADGGTHVKNTEEIGHLELVKCDNKGKNNRRVYFRLV